MIGVDGHPAKGTSGMHGLLVRSGHGLCMTIEIGIVRGAAEVHRDIVSFAGRGMDALGITGVWGGSSTSTKMGLTDVTFEGRVGKVAVWRGLAGEEVGVGERICRSVAYRLCSKVRETVGIIGGDGHRRGETGDDALG